MREWKTLKGSEDCFNMVEGRTSNIKEIMLQHHVGGTPAIVGPTTAETPASAWTGARA
jgi:hypothetical protein